VQAGGYATRDGAAYDKGSVADLPDDLAVKLMNYGVAVVAPAAPVIETAEVAAPENAAKRTHKPVPRTRK
jgi:hypothetical protein